MSHLTVQPLLSRVDDGTLSIQLPDSFNPIPRRPRGIEINQRGEG